MRRPDSFKEQQGYLTFAQNNNTTDYLNMAYLQALSIKATQKINRYAVVVDAKTKELITDKHRAVFDYIIDLPQDDAANDEWKLGNEWQAFMLTPFKETVKLEADILFTRNIDHWWHGMQQTEVCLTSKVMDYEGNVATSRAYRALFDENNLPDVYNGFMYFRFSRTALEFFALAREIYHNWQHFREQVLTNCRDERPTTDVVYAIVAILIGVEKCTNPALSYPTFVHMKGAMNGFGQADDWTEKLYHQVNDNAEVSIGMVKQMYPVHYYIKEFVTPELIKHYEQLAR